MLPQKQLQQKQHPTTWKNEEVKNRNKQKNQLITVFNDRLDFNIIIKLN